MKEFVIEPCMSNDWGHTPDLSTIAPAGVSTQPKTRLKSFKEKAGRFMKKASVFARKAAVVIKKVALAVKETVKTTAVALSIVVTIFGFFAKISTGSHGATV